jgi:hypothetical protein
MNADSSLGLLDVARQTFVPENKTNPVPAFIRVNPRPSAFSGFLERVPN